MSEITTFRVYATDGYGDAIDLEKKIDELLEEELVSIKRRMKTLSLFIEKNKKGELLASGKNLSDLRIIKEKLENKNVSIDITEGTDNMRGKKVYYIRVGK